MTLFDEEQQLFDVIFVILPDWATVRQGLRFTNPLTH